MPGARCTRGLVCNMRKKAISGAGAWIFAPFSVEHTGVLRFFPFDGFRPGD